MMQSVPLHKLEEMYRELEAATDVTGNFDVKRPEAITTLHRVEDFLTLLRPVCVIPDPIQMARSAFSKDVFSKAVEAFGAPQGFFESVDSVLATAGSTPLSRGTREVLRQIQTQRATSDQLETVRKALQKFDAIQPMMARLDAD